jgi:glycosyltransferase involved in cell wall biosynthesis
VVSSLHTNTPEYARITTSRLLERALGRGLLYRAANDRLRLPIWVRTLLQRRLARHRARVTSVMAGYGEASEAGDGGGALRRGLDRAVFDPARRDRGWFERRFGLPPGRFIVMYAGKLNAGKNVPMLAPVVDRVRREGVPVHLFCAGAGAERAALEGALGAALTCSGPLDQDELARAYASADLFLFPSMIDESGNAAVEALASGLPSLIAAGSGVASRMADCPGLRILPGDDVEPWAAAIAELAAMPEQRAAMGRAARAYVEASVPDWAEVLGEDLLPVWQMATARAAA